MRIITQGEEETKILARKIAAGFRGGRVLALYGDLGSGKTVFAKGVAEAMEIKTGITSPTFVISKIYPIYSHPNLKRLVHIDAYRLGGADDFAAIGGIELVNDPENLCLIEWPDAIKGVLPAGTLSFYFRYLSENRREIKYEI